VKLERHGRLRRPTNQVSRPAPATSSKARVKLETGDEAPSTNQSVEFMYRLV